MTDKEFDHCMDQIGRGEKEGLRRIYEEYGTFIYKTLLSTVKIPQDAEDLTSDLFLRLWKKAEQYRRGAGHKAYLARIAHNMAVDHLASKGKIIIAVDNKFGLKNWTTAARPNLATKDEIVEKALEKKLKLTSTYYPVPDFTFPLEVYSEYNLPKEGAIRTAAPEFEQDKTLLMDEPTAFSEMIREGRFDEYANSYILIFEKKGGRK